MNTKYTPVAGTVYNSWTVISNNIYTNGRTAYWLVQCKCGSKVRRAAHVIVKGTTKSCKSCARTQLYKNSFSLSYYNKIIKRAKKIGVDINVEPDYLYELFLKQEKKCNLSGIDISFKTKWSDSEQTASLDRIDSSKGYIKGNVQWVHKSVNFMKHSLSQEEFIKLCKAVASKCS